MFKNKALDALFVQLTTSLLYSQRSSTAGRDPKEHVAGYLLLEYYICIWTLKNNSLLKTNFQSNWLAKIQTIW